MADARLSTGRSVKRPLIPSHHSPSKPPPSPRLLSSCSGFLRALAVWLTFVFIAVVTLRLGILLYHVVKDAGSSSTSFSSPLSGLQTLPSASQPQSIELLTNLTAEHKQVKDSLANESSQAAADTNSYKTYGSRCAGNLALPGARKIGSVDGFKYYLAAVIANRVFEQDYFHLTSYDIKQWIEYMLYAGVEHIYWYDTAHEDSESQEAHLAKYVEMGLLTYHRFHHLFPESFVYGYHFEQDNTYRHLLDHYAGDAKWMVELDVDEYPFSVQDTSSCFLRRIVQKLERKHTKISQILMQCMFFFGNPVGDLENGWLAEKYQRRKHETEGKMAGHYTRQKPIFRSNLALGVKPVDPHMFPMKEGVTVVAEAEEVRMNHYWGSRATNFGPDTEELLKTIRSDSSIQAIVDRLKEATGLKRKNSRLER